MNKEDKELLSEIIEDDPTKADSYMCQRRKIVE